MFWWSWRSVHPENTLHSWEQRTMKLCYTICLHQSSKLSPWDRFTDYWKAHKSKRQFNSTEKHQKKQTLIRDILECWGLSVCKETLLWDSKLCKLLLTVCFQWHPGSISLNITTATTINFHSLCIVMEEEGLLEMPVGWWSQKNSWWQKGCKGPKGREKLTLTWDLRHFLSLENNRDVRVW